MPQPLSPVIEQIGRIILGKEHQIRLTIACLLARGHLLIEDLPGVGKTTLAHALARTLGLDFQRIQFTSDLLPADILGVSVFDRDSSAFKFHPGPVFSQVILADEVNRATPKAQSALLEAMEEHQVTTEGQTRPLPEPFFVIASSSALCAFGVARFTSSARITCENTGPGWNLNAELSRSKIDTPRISAGRRSLVNWMR